MPAGTTASGNRSRGAAALQLLLESLGGPARLGRIAARCAAATAASLVSGDNTSLTLSDTVLQRPPRAPPSSRVRDAAVLEAAAAGRRAGMLRFDTASRSSTATARVGADRRPAAGGGGGAAAPPTTLGITEYFERRSTSARWARSRATSACSARGWTRSSFRRTSRGSPDCTSPIQGPSTSSSTARVRRGDLGSRSMPRREQDAEATCGGCPAEAAQLRVRFCPQRAGGGLAGAGGRGRSPTACAWSPAARRQVHSGLPYLNHDRLQAHLTGAVQALARRTEAARSGPTPRRPGPATGRGWRLEAKLELLTGRSTGRGPTH